VIAGRNAAKIAGRRCKRIAPKACAVDQHGGGRRDDESSSAVPCSATVASRHGRLDILVNNAGTNVRKQPQD
jgi:NAD(P)-dependent dehydrogenase (short-subunit alcohol dehydrogenase family)